MRARLAAPLALATSLLTALAVAAPAVPAAAADSGGAGLPPVLNIDPPGARGNVDAGQAAQLGLTNLPGLLSDPSDPKGALTTATPTTPEHFADQWEAYDALNKPDPASITTGDLTKYFKDAAIDVPPGQVTSTERPKAGVVIRRDTAGVPHIHGDTRADVSYGAGYAVIEDRMFLTDVLRHTGEAKMAEFVGPTPANIAMDREQLRLAPYTEQEASAQIDAVVKRYPKEGGRLLTSLDAFLAGMNAAQRKLCPLAFTSPLPGDAGAGFGPHCPVEYAALGKPPTPYTRPDIVAIASLVGGIFGKGGGGELANAVWLEQLQRKFGDAQGKAIYDDLREKNDPEAPTTSPDRLPFMGGGVDPSKPGVAMPDLHGPTAPGTGADAGSSSPLPSLPAPGATPPGFGIVDGPFGPIDLGLRPHGMSNALLVDAQHSASGHPVAVFGPQTGYYTPQLLFEEALDGPGVKARGVSFAGTNLVVELGRGVDYAWSATSSSDDNVDTVMDRLCNADGSTPTVQSTSYVGPDGSCVPMESYVHTETALPNLASPGAPQQLKMLVLKTRHGVVQERTTCGGVPVAVVSQRSTYNHELDSVVGFARANDPGYVHDAKSFQRAFSAVDYTFNWFYVDAHDIAYFNSALLPLRAPGTDPDLPRWGDAKYDWRGMAGFAQHPKVIDPPTGFLVSWNNKQAPGFAAADNNWGYGPVYRSLALSDRVQALVDKGAVVTRGNLTGAMIDAATVDVRAAYLLGEVLDVVGSDGLSGQDAKAVALLRSWLADGAHRVDRDRDGSYAHQAAIELFDVWWEPKAAGAAGDFSLPKDVLRGTLGDLVDQLPQPLDDHPRQGIGSAWNDVAWYGYVSKDLRQVLGQPVQGAYSRTYCGGGSLAACRDQLRASLHKAVQAALSAEGVSSVAALTYDKSTDFIRPVTAGLVGVRPIDWQNRPTFQQVVMFTGSRPGVPAAGATGSAGGHRGGTAPGPAAGSTEADTPDLQERAAGTLAMTGGSPLLPAAAALLVVAAAAALRLRRRTG